MSKIREEGTYRGSVISSAVGLTKNDYPQLIAEFQAEEKFEPNETSGEWIPCEEPFETLTAYLVLVDRTGAMTKNAEQVQSSMNWSGKSFAELNDADYSDTRVQFRVETNEFPAGVFKLQVSWLDPYDADPNRGIKKLDKAAVKNLNSKYGAALRAFGKKASTKAAAVPSSAPKKSSGRPKKTKIAYDADSIWDRFRAKYPDTPEDDLCTEWENYDEAFEVDIDDRTEEEWKEFEIGLPKITVE